jgi:hypothetical protein
MDKIASAVKVPSRRAIRSFQLLTVKVEHIRSAIIIKKVINYEIRSTTTS